MLVESDDVSAAGLEIKPSTMFHTLRKEQVPLPIGAAPLRYNYALRTGGAVCLNCSLWSISSSALEPNREESSHGHEDMASPHRRR